MWETLLGAVAGPLLGGLFGSDASGKASDAQVQSGQESNALQRWMFDQNRNDLAPWRNVGGQAVNRLGSLMEPGGDLTRSFGMEDFETDPGYQFRMSEGLKGLERAGLRSGGIDGGPMQKGFARFAGDLASQEYGNAYIRFNQDQSNLYNRLAGLSGTGQTSAQQVAGLGANMAGNVGNTLQGMGNSRASGYIGGANALSGALGQGYNNYLGQQMVDAFGRPKSAGTNNLYGSTDGLDFGQSTHSWW